MEISTAPVIAAQPLTHDVTVTIAVGQSRKELHWVNKTMTWSELSAKLSQTTRSAETVDEYNRMTRDEQAEVKDVGGFVGGTLTDGSRKAGNVVDRQIITLDADFAEVDLWENLLLWFPNSALLYSTHSHRGDSPRYRLVLLLSRPVTPDEYQAIARLIAQDIGIEQFDDTTYEPHRLMYWPSTSADGVFVFEPQDGPPLDPDAVLSRYPGGWQDQSTWPESSRTHGIRKTSAMKKGDPTQKGGIVGPFCTAYPVPEAIDTFLSGIYARCADPNRYTYIAGTSSGGLVLYDGDKFAFSHHSTDPVAGQLVNSFDLVRIHKFGAMDEGAKPNTPCNRLPSYVAMAKLAAEDPKVRRAVIESAKEDFGGTLLKDNSWKGMLAISSKGGILSTAANVQVIFTYDPAMAGKVGLNTFTQQPVILGDLPWHKVQNLLNGDAWQDSDDSELRLYLEKEYGISNREKIYDALVVAMNERQFHPVRSYLESLEWDGIPRMDTLFVDYLRAEDSPYIRAVTRKMLVGAVARVQVPGVKFDYVPVIYGDQGIGKSELIKRIAKTWHSDTLTTVQGKESYEQLQGVWIIEMAELTATRKAEVESIKHFITKREDVFRPAYGRRLCHFPRQCVFVGTTNDKEFLRDQTGNRRFWPVVAGTVAPQLSVYQHLTSDEVDQIWAEAVEAWDAGETLFLDPIMELESTERQADHTEESPRTGQVLQYLEKLLPENWNELDLASRRAFLHGHDFDAKLTGTVQRQQVCAMEVWAELFAGDLKMIRSIDGREINTIIRNSKQWQPSTAKGGKRNFGKLYGTQRAYIRMPAAQI